MGQEISNSKYFEILFFLITVEMYPQDVKNIAISVYKKSKSLREVEYLTSISKSSIKDIVMNLLVKMTKKYKKIFFETKTSFKNKYIIRM